jgi:putative sigma-54 modulation protein
MRLDITGRQVEITPGIRQLITKSLAKIERLLNDRAVSATVVLAKEKYRHITEVMLHAKGDHILSGLGEGNTWPLSVRKAAAKIENQAQKLKSKWAEGRHGHNRPGKRTVVRRRRPSTDSCRARREGAVPGQADVRRGRGNAARVGVRHVPRVPQRGERIREHPVPPQGWQSRTD